MNFMAGGILLLSNNANAWDLFSWMQRKIETFLFSGRVSPEIVKMINPSLIVSYNYKFIIPDDVINLMEGQIVNLHISLLPWNRGSSPNFWSFISNTPKGVTIHRVEKGLDTGKIIVQKEYFFDEKRETFASTYNALQNGVVELFKENFDRIFIGNYSPYKQKGEGSYHTVKDMDEYLKDRTFSWDMNICDFKKMEF